MLGIGPSVQCFRTLPINLSRKIITNKQTRYMFSVLSILKLFLWNLSFGHNYGVATLSGIFIPSLKSIGHKMLKMGILTFWSDGRTDGWTVSNYRNTLLFKMIQNRWIIVPVRRCLNNRLWVISVFKFNNEKKIFFLS